MEKVDCEFNEQSDECEIYKVISMNKRKLSMKSEIGKVLVRPGMEIPKRMKA